MPPIIRQSRNHQASALYRSNLICKAACTLVLLVGLLPSHGWAQEQQITFSDLLDQLKSADINIRRRTMQRLESYGEEAKRNVPVIIANLNDPRIDARRNAIQLLEQFGEVAKEIVPALRIEIKNQDDIVRNLAIKALAKIEPEAEKILPALISALKDQDARIRTAAAVALTQVGQDAKGAIPELITMLKDQDENVRQSARYALGIIGMEAKAPPPALIAALKDQDANTRSGAALALGMMGSVAKDAVPALIMSLKDEDVYVRIQAAQALGQIGRTATEAIPALMGTFKDQNEDVSRKALSALGRIKPEDPEIFPLLMSALKDQDRNVRRNAADALGMAWQRADEVLPALISMLNDPIDNVRFGAAGSLGSLAQALFDTKNTQTLPQLKSAYYALKDHPDANVRHYADRVKRTVDYFDSLPQVGVRNSIEQLVQDHYIICGVVIAYLILQLFWLLFFGIRPLWLLSASEFLKWSVKIKPLGIEFDFPARQLLLISLFHYRSHVLDAWVRHYLAIAKDNFASHPTVAQRKVYVAMPVTINNQIGDSPSAAQLQPIFAKRKVTALLVGEGGAGKTSLACQMANWAMSDEPEQRLCKTHRMLPVLIEGNLDARTDGKDALLEIVRGRLQDLIGEPKAIFEDLLLELLRKRRVLVIVDSLSELNEMTRKSVRPAQTDFPVAALVVTSRLDEDLGGAAKTIMKPLRLKSDHLGIVKK
ncbi:MAG: HEAT repeat domain-containing protein [Acidobacteriota bacterium]